MQCKYICHFLELNLQNGLISTLPYLAMFLMSFPVGMVADYLRIKDYMSLSTLRKLFQSMGTICPGLCMVALGFVGCNSALAIAILVSNTLSVYLDEKPSQVPSFTGGVYWIECRLLCRF